MKSLDRIVWDYITSCWWLQSASFWIFPWGEIRYFGQTFDILLRVSYCLLEISRCEEMPCERLRTIQCTEVYDGFSCLCLDGFTGTFCEKGKTKWNTKHLSVVQILEQLLMESLFLTLTFSKYYKHHYILSIGKRNSYYGNHFYITLTFFPNITNIIISCP